MGLYGVCKPHIWVAKLNAYNIVVMENSEVSVGALMLYVPITEMNADNVRMER